MKKDWMIKESELDEDQIKILMATLDKSCVVTGCAGSGKSILALLKAQRIQKERGDNYQIIVFTKALCGYMNSGRKELGLHRQLQYHWNWKNKLSCPSADYTIVDEIQDFSEDEIKEFTTATNKHFFFFGDTAQSIYDSLKTTLPVEDIGYLFPRGEKPKTFDLYRNYRLPRPVARIVQYVGVDLSPYDESTYKSNENEIPYILKYNNVEEQIKAIIDIVRRKDLTDVAILVPHNEMVKIVGEYLSDLNINFEQKYSDKRDYFNNKENLDFSTTNLKVMTYHSAKGLQFETVFLPMIEDFNDDGNSSRKALYVAMTRTYRNLYLLYSHSLPEPLSKIPIELYKTSETEDIDDI